MPAFDSNLKVCALSRVPKYGMVPPPLRVQASAGTPKARFAYLFPNSRSSVIQVRLKKKENIYCLANVPGDCRIDLNGIKSHFQAEGAAFASREKAQELTGCVMGAVPPFSFNEQLQVLADPLIQENEEVVPNEAIRPRQLPVDDA